MGFVRTVRGCIQTGLCVVVRGKVKEVFALLDWTAGRSDRRQVVVEYTRDDTIRVTNDYWRAFFHEHNAELHLDAMDLHPDNFTDAN